MPSDKRKFGDLGEELAENFLKQKGYKTIEKNYRIKNIGEIDIVCEKKNRLIFIEVKTRRVKWQTNFPIEYSINAKKRLNLKRICNIYLNEKQCFTKDWQVDAVFIKLNEAGEYSIDHLENILWEEYY